MTQRSITYLKAKFETNDVPTQTDYQDVFDSFLSLESSATQSFNGKLEGPRVSVAVVSAFDIYSVRTYRSYKTAVSAAGTTTGSAASVSAEVALVYANADERSVRFTTCEPGRVQFLSNTNTTTISVFPSPGCNFIGTAADAPLLLAKLGSMQVIHHTASAYGVIRTQGI